MQNYILFLLIVFPFLAALTCYTVRVRAIRSAIVAGTGAVLTISAILLAGLGPLNLKNLTVFGLDGSSVIHFADFLILGIIFMYGFRYRNMIIQLLSVLQFVMLLAFTLFMPEGSHSAGIFCDSLSLIMVLIISIVGSLICVFAIPYMQAHEEHLKLSSSGQPRFFAVMLLFLGAMNGLVLTNDLLHFYFFFEVTTLCSFLLIGHDQNETAKENAVTALWMNCVGGFALLAGLIWIYISTGTLDIQMILAIKPLTAGLIIPVGLLCIAGFTKAAQMPMQSWLLGAMVAPTPTSALLHSSTMVKAGVYLVIRFAPAFAGTFLSTAIALCGAFTFLAAAALAIGQSNGKKVLAYSTISNLGLILACAGINTEYAITAAILLTVFHAVSKALLFLCVGSIEQHIGSRNIEDMRGLYGEMPRTALIIGIGVLTMILPPFGMLLGKWMAIESAAGNIFIVFMLALGSALTVVYWARWAGILLGSHYTGSSRPETGDPMTMGPLVVLLSGSVILSLGAPLIYLKMIEPYFAGQGGTAFSLTSMQGYADTFAVLPIFIVMIIAGLVYWKFFSGRGVEISEPYMSGIQADKPATYIGPMNKDVTLRFGNYYLESIFGEEKLTPWFNRLAIMLIILMIGGAL